MTVRLSVVTSLFKSAQFVEEFYRRSMNAAARLTPDWEIVMVNDGSPDDSLERAIKLHQRDSRVRVVDLSRNFGHHKALMTGLTHSRGELIFLIDADLEEDPAWLSTFHDAMQATRADVIYGVQRSRKGSWLERATGAVFYGVFNKLLTFPFPRNVVTARFMTRRYVNALVQHQDQEINLAGGMPRQLFAYYRYSTLLDGFFDIIVTINLRTSYSNKQTTRHNLARIKHNGADLHIRCALQLGKWQSG